MGVQLAQRGDVGGVVEVLFYLALTFGLTDDPIAAVEQAVRLVEATAERHGVPHPFQGTVATTDGESIWAFRYSSERRSRTLLVSAWPWISGYSDGSIARTRSRLTVAKFVEVAVVY